MAAVRRILGALSGLIWAAHDALVARQWWPPKDKAQWVTSLAVAVAATFLAAVTYRLNRARGTPILVLEHDGRSAFVRNIGQGIALNAIFTDDDDEVKRFVGSIASGEKVPLGYNASFDLNYKHRLYYHDVQRGVFGRRLWTRTTLHGTGLGFERQGQPFVTDHAQRIWLVPPSVLRRAQLHTPWDQLQRLGRWYDPRNWPRRVFAWWMPRYRSAVRWIDQQRQYNLHRQFVDTLADYPRDDPPREQRQRWPFDISDYGDKCGKRHPFEMVQTSCGLDDERGRYVCHVKLVFAGEWLRGLVVVPVDTFHRWPDDRDERSQRLFDAVRKYYCRWRPRTTFILIVD